MEETCALQPPVLTGAALLEGKGRFCVTSFLEKGSQAEAVSSMGEPGGVWIRLSSSREQVACYLLYLLVISFPGTDRREEEVKPKSLVAYLLLGSEQSNDDARCHRQRPRSHALFTWPSCPRGREMDQIAAQILSQT